VILFLFFAVQVAYARPVQVEHGAVFGLVPGVDKVSENVCVGRLSEQLLLDNVKLLYEFIVGEC
jgi:hypothetical protein